MVKGIEKVKGQEQVIKNIFSLNYLIEELGFNYLKQQHQKLLSYREIENILIKYKSRNSWMTFDHIKEILRPFEKKMKVDYRTKVEGKRIQLYKVMNLLTEKICLHQDCSSKKGSKRDIDPSDYLEILCQWGCVQNVDLMAKSGEKLIQIFTTFMEKRYATVIYLSMNDCQLVLERFLQKYFPLMSQESVKKIVLKIPAFADNQLDDQQIKKEDLIQGIFTYLCFHGEDQLFEYIFKTHEGIQNRQKLIKQVVKPDKQDINSQSHKQSVPKQGDSRSSDHKSSDNIQSQNKQSDSVRSFNNPSQMEEPKHKAISSRTNIPQLSQRAQFEVQDEEQQDMKKKFKQTVSFVQKEQHFNSTLQQKKPKDILKACFMMDNFLERYALQHKRPQIDEDKESYDANEYFDEGQGDFNNDLSGVPKKDSVPSTPQTASPAKKKRGSIKVVISEDTPQSSNRFFPKTAQSPDLKPTPVQQQIGQDKAPPFEGHIVQQTDENDQEEHKANPAGGFTSQMRSKIRMVTAVNFFFLSNKLGSHPHDDGSKRKKKFQFHINEEQIQFEKQRQIQFQEEKRRDKCCNIM